MDAFQETDLTEIAEIILDITTTDSDAINTFIQRYTSHCPVRLALPAVTRVYEEPRLLKKISRFLDSGITRWAVSNLSGLSYLSEGWNTLDVLADWPLYTLNAQAIDELRAQGFSGITLSPEDTGENLKRLVEHDPSASVLVYQDTPLAISEACVMATDTCRQETCSFRETKVVSQRDSMLAINHNCRTILINDLPYSICGHLDDLRSNGARYFRADFIWRDYTPETVQRIWQQLRSGAYSEPTHAGSSGRRI